MHLHKYISPTLPVLVTLQEHAYTSSKRNSVKFNPEDSVPGFRVEPRLLPTTVQVPEFGSTRNMGGYTDHSMVPVRACSSVHVANTSTPRENASSHSHIPQIGVRDAAQVTDPNQPPDRPASAHKNPPEVKDTIVSILPLGESLSFIFLSSYILLAFCGQNHGRRFRRIHHSGPLVPPGGNMEDMLKEHERHIQEAVRKARLSKVSRYPVEHEAAESS